MIPDQQAQGVLVFFAALCCVLEPPSQAQDVSVWYCQTQCGLRQPLTLCFTKICLTGELTLICVRCRVSSPHGPSCRPSRATVALRFAWTSACVSWSTRAALPGKMRPRDGGKLGWHPPGLLRRELLPLVTLQVLSQRLNVSCLLGHVLLQKSFENLSG